MSGNKLLVIVPTRGRPHNIRKVIRAWEATDAFVDAHLLLAVDADDPKLEQYRALASPTVWVMEHAEWMPMVPKLNETARHMVMGGIHWPYVAFMGDDHIPRTRGWARMYAAELRRMGTGIVYGDDRVQGEKLCTQWAMTSNIVRTLGRMVPASVEHLYCDNAIMDLGRAADCIKYLPGVVIEHAHPVAGRGEWDAGYERVNSRQQYASDHRRYQSWVAEELASDVDAVRKLIFTEKIKTVGTISKLTKPTVTDSTFPDGQKCKVTTDELGNRIRTGDERQDVKIRAPRVIAKITQSEERSGT